MTTKDKKPAAPAHVAICGLGPSVRQYLEVTRRAGGRSSYCDETWGINALGDVLVCDRIFHMDDVRIQEVRAKARPRSNIAAMLQWMRRSTLPIYTSRLHPDYPGLVAFPLEAVLNELGGIAYFNSTAAYAVAYAVYLGVRKISIFGFDYTYPNAHDAERGRACVEFWLGVAHVRGIQIRIPQTSSLMDAMYVPQEKLYGYDTLAVTQQTHKGRLKLIFTPKAAPLPTAEAIEKKYDHSRHPSAPVEAERSQT